MKQISKYFAFKGEITYFFVMFLIITEQKLNHDNIRLLNKIIFFLLQSKRIQRIFCFNQLILEMEIFLINGI